MSDTKKEPATINHATRLTGAEIIWATDPDLSSWMQRSRLNATCGMADHQGDPQMKSALARLFTNIEPAISKLETLMAGIRGGVLSPL